MDQQINTKTNSTYPSKFLLSLTDKMLERLVRQAALEQRTPTSLLRYLIDQHCE